MTDHLALDLDLTAEANRTLRRLLPRLEATFAGERVSDAEAWRLFAERLERHFATLFASLFAPYGGRYDFLYHLELILEAAARALFARSPKLRALDARRDTESNPFLDHRAMGAVLYVDRWAGTLGGVRDRIPYLQELGITYLHLMPLFRAPDGDSDGGYAVSSYQEVDPKLGTMDELEELARELRQVGISLCLDFVFNHTSDEHTWAIEARQFPDDPDRNCYFLFPDRTLPDAYDRTLREIFPTVRRGSFTWVPDAGEAGRWVWTTFNSFQWDLDYSNPLTFRRMAGEMLFLANRGIEVLRLDAVAFIWKRLGTPSESLPEAHALVRAFNALTRIAAPALLFKSEAIVHPAEVATYIDPAECQLSYNPLLMALLWETLATRDASLLAASMRRWFPIPEGCAWVNYVRSHDDIGWTFDDADAARLGINGFDHRAFLNQFYTGRFPGSFARGVPFQENPDTGDARISGTAASLAGLEKALVEEGPDEVELAHGRLLMLHSVALAIGGLPLLYLGDELATLNDKSYVDDPAHAADSRWVHRPEANLAALARRTDPQTIEGRMYGELRRRIRIRQREAVFSGSEMTVVETGNPHVFAFLRRHGGEVLLALHNATEQPQAVHGSVVAPLVSHAAVDLVSGAGVAVADELSLSAYQVMWLTPD